MGGEETGVPVALAMSSGRWVFVTWRYAFFPGKKYFIKNKKASGVFLKPPAG